MPTLNLDDAAQFLQLKPRELLHQVKIGRVNGSNFGRGRWVFLKDDLEKAIKQNYANPQGLLLVIDNEHPKGKTLCQFTNAKTTRRATGTSTTTCQTAAEYNDLLKPKTKGKRKNCTTA